MLTFLMKEMGVTLIELMISLVVLAMLMVLGLPSFSTWVNNVQIRNAADSIFNGLQLAKSEAVRRNYTVGFNFGGASEWSVGCIPAVADTTDDADTEPDCPAVIQQRSGSQGSQNTTVNVSNLDGTRSLVFSGIGRLVGGLQVAGSVAVFDIQSSLGSCAPAGRLHCLRIVVGQGGQIRMCDPALSITAPLDARAC